MDVSSPRLKQLLKGPRVPCGARCEGKRHGRGRDEGQTRSGRSDRVGSFGGARSRCTGQKDRRFRHDSRSARRRCAGGPYARPDRQSESADVACRFDALGWIRLRGVSTSVRRTGCVRPTNIINCQDAEFVFLLFFLSSWRFIMFGHSTPCTHPASARRRVVLAASASGFVAPSRNAPAGRCPPPHRR